MKFISVAFFLSVGLTFAVPSPERNKNESSKVSHPPVAATVAAPSLEKKIESSIYSKEVKAENEEEGLDLLRAKKSTPITTFCVEIKPGTDETSVVVCDPNKKDQQLPLPGSTTTTILPKPSKEESTYNIPQTIPNFISGLQSILPNQQQQIIPQDPLIFIPQQPQIPQIGQPGLYPQIYNPQPQIIFVQDPNCNSNKLSTGTNQLLTNLIQSQNLYAKQSTANGKSAYPMYGGQDQNQEIWTGGFNTPNENQLRAFSGTSTNSDSLPNPLDLIYPRRGVNAPNRQNILQPQQQQQQQLQPQQQPQQQQNQNQNPFQFPMLPQGNTDSDNQYDRPFLIQCNPVITPLSQEAYSAATAANGPLGGSGGTNRPFFRSATLGYGQPIVSGNQAMYMAQSATPYQRQVLASQTVPNGVYQQLQMPNSEMMGKMASFYQRNAVPAFPGMQISQGGEGGLGGGGGGGGRGDMSQMMQRQGMTADTAFGKGSGIDSSQSMATHSLNIPSENQGHNSPNGFQNGEGEERREGGGVGGGGGGGVVTGAATSSFAQGGNDKDKEFQKQMHQEFSHLQQHDRQQQMQQQMQQQEITRNGSGNHGTGEIQPQLSRASERMHQMKSSISQGNMVQPFMMPANGLAGEKLIQSKT